MIEHLTALGYEATKAKLANMEVRLEALVGRTDVTPHHREAVRRSYLRMMSRYRAELKLFEAADQMGSARSS